MSYIYCGFTVGLYSAEQVDNMFHNSAVQIKNMLYNSAEQVDNYDREIKRNQIKDANDSGFIIFTPKFMPGALCQRQWVCYITTRHNRAAGAVEYLIIILRTWSS